MKKTCLLVLLLLIISSTRVRAHGGKNEPLLHINGKFAQDNPLSHNAIKTNLTVATDLSPETYVVGAPIRFAINDELLQGPSGKSSSTFYWDFGDTSVKKEGESVTHSYTAPGSYIVTVLVRYPTQKNLYPLDNLLIQVLPTKTYQPPTSVISATRITQSDGHTLVVLDASESKGNDLTYHWDLGDGQTAQGVSTRYSYKNGTYFAFLRVTDVSKISSDSGTLLKIEQHAVPLWKVYFEKLLAPIKRLFF